MSVDAGMGFWKGFFLIFLLSLPVLLTISDVVHRLLVGMKLPPWYTLFGLLNLIPRRLGGRGGSSFKGGGGGFGGGGASGGW